MPAFGRALDFLAAALDVFARARHGVTACRKKRDYGYDELRRDIQRSFKRVLAQRIEKEISPVEEQICWCCDRWIVAGRSNRGFSGISLSQLGKRSSAVEFGVERSTSGNRI